MGYNYCLVITKKEVVGLVLELLKKEKLSAKLITKSDGSELVINENSLISYFGRSFPDLEEIFPDNGKVIIWTIFIQNAKELKTFLY